MINYEDLSKKIIGYRHDLHQIPELGFLVYKTSDYCRHVLEQFDCKITTIVSTGLLAYFDFGAEETIIFRADMDALPIEENTGLEFSSTHEGCMHACGHDGHMSIMLGFAEVLDKYKSEGRNMRYNALLLFQPAEETIDGALRICNTGIFDEYNIKAIFGLHLWPTLSKGEIASRPGPMMAKSTEVDIDFEGVSAHCGDPENGVDALEAASHFIYDIYQFKRIYIKDNSVLKFGMMESGTVRNAISPFTHLKGTMRTFHEDTWEMLTHAMEYLGDACEKKYDIKFHLDVSKSHPAVINEEGLYNEIKPYIVDNLNYVELRKPVLIAEDFSFFEKQLPGVFFFLGTGSGIPLHSDNYTFEEDVLIEGVKLFNTLFTNM